MPSSLRSQLLTRPHRRILVNIVAMIWLSLTCQAQPDDPQEAIQRRHNERYLKLLLRQPRQGTALDRVYAFHIDRGSVDGFLESLRNDADDDGGHQMIIGLVELRRGNDRQARDAFQKAATQRNSDPLAPWYLGQTLIALGETQAAAEALEESLRRRPAKADAAEIFELLGRTLQRSGKTEAALDVWKRFETAFPGDARVQEQIATALAAEGELADAQERFESLAQRSIDPYKRVQFGLKAAELQMQAGKQQEAIQSFEDLLQQLKPDSWVFNDIRRRIEASYLKADDYTGLIDYYNRWLESHESDVDAMARLAKYLAWEEENEKAREWYSRAISKAPTNTRLREALIDQLVAEKDFATAVEQAEELSRLEPANTDYIERWGSLYLKHPDLSEAERSEKAADIWATLLEKKGGDVVTVSRVADLLRTAQRQEEAIELYRKAVELAPDDPQYREYLGEYLHSLKRHDEAIQTWKQIANGERRSTSNLVRLSEIYVRFRLPDLALSTLRNACELDPELSDRLRLARMLQENGKPREALDQLELTTAMASSDDERETILKSEIRILQDAELLRDHAATFARKLNAPDSDPLAADWRRLALYQRALGDLRDAATSAQRARKANPDSVAALRLLAELADEAGLIANALTAYRDLTQADSRSRSDHLKKVSELHRRLGQRDEAIQAAEELVETAPDNPDHYRFLADLCFAVGEAERGLEALRRAVRVNPADVAALKTLANTLADRFKTAEAIELYWRAFDKADSTEAQTTIIQTLTELHLRTNHFDRLVSRLRNMSRGSSDRRDTLICLANAFEAAEDPGNARQTLEELLADNSRDVFLLTELTRLAEQSADFASAAEYQRRFNELRPTGEGTVRLADFIAKSGNDDAAESLWSKLSVAQMDHSLVLQTIDQLIGQEKYEIAEQFSRGLLTSNPNDWEAQVRLVILAALQDHHDEVDEYCESLLDFDVAEDAMSTRSINGIEATQGADASSVISQTMPSLINIDKAAFGIVQWVGRQHTAPQQVSTGSFMSLNSQQQQSRIQQLYFSQRVGVATPTGGSFSGRLAEISSFRCARAVSIGLSMTRANQENRSAERLTDFSDDCLNVDTPQTADVWNWYFAAASATDSQSALSKLFALLGEQGDVESHFGRLLLFAMKESQFEVSSETLFESWNVVAAKQPGWLPHVESIFNKVLARDQSGDMSERVIALLTREEADRVELKMALPLAARGGDLGKVQLIFDRMYPPDVSDALSAEELADLGTNLIPVFASSPVTAESTEWGVLRHLFSEFLQLKSRHWAPVRVGATPDSAQIFLTEATQERLSYDRYWSNADVAFFAAVNQRFTADKSTELFSLLREFRNTRQGASAAMAEMAMAEFANLVGDRERTNLHLVRASELAPEDAPLRMAIVRRLKKSGNEVEALAILETIVPTDQQSMKERELMALSLAQSRGQVDRAKLAAERLFGIRMSPKESMGLVSTLNRLDMRDKAQAVLSRVRKKGGNSLETLSQLLDQYLKDGNNDIAREIAHKVLRATSGSKSARNNVQVRSARTNALRHLAATGDLQVMIARTREQIERAPGSVDLYRNLQEYYRFAGMTREAAELEVTIRKLQPESDQRSDLIARARSAAQRKQTSEAQAFYLQILDRDPKHFANNYYEYLNAFDQRSAVNKLADRVISMDLATVRNGSQIAAELIQRLGRNRDESGQSTAKAMELLKKTWDAFPAYRRTLVSTISSQSIWNQPVMFEYAKEVVLPQTAQQAIAKPWTGVAENRQFVSEGHMTGLVTRLKQHLAGEKLAGFTADVTGRVNRFEDWLGGKLLLALLNAHAGQHDAADAQLDAVRASGMILPINTAWVLATELPAIDARYTGIAADFLYASVTTHWQSVNIGSQQVPSYTISPRRLAATLLAQSGRRREALDLIFRSAEDIPDNIPPERQALMKLTQYRSIAEHLAQLNFRIHAVRYFESVTHELAAKGRSVHGNRVAPDHRIVEESQRSAARLIASATVSHLSGWLNLEVERLAADDQPQPINLFLRPARNGMNEESISSIVLDIVRKVRPPSPGSSQADLAARLNQLMDAVPREECSVAVISVVWADRTSDDQLRQKALGVLERHCETKMTPTTSEIALWLAAKSAMNSPKYREAGQRLAARAELAARTTDAAGWYLGILRWRGELALAAGDKATAEIAWTQLLDAVLADTAIPASVPSDVGGAKTGVSGSDEISRPSAASVLKEVRARLLNKPTEQAP